MISLDAVIRRWRSPRARYPGERTEEHASQAVKKSFPGPVGGFITTRKCGLGCVGACHDECALRQRRDGERRSTHADRRSRDDEVERQVPPITLSFDAMASWIGTLGALSGASSVVLGYVRDKV